MAALHRWHLRLLPLFSTTLLAGAVLAEALPPGTPVEDAERPTIQGGKAHLLGGTGKVSVVVFFRPGQEFSAVALGDLSQLEMDSAQKNIAFAGVVSEHVPAPDVAKLVAQTKLKMPVLVDKDDVLYGRFGIVNHPVVVFVDAQHRIIAYQNFSNVNYRIFLASRVKHALKEITDDELAAILHPTATRAAVHAPGALAHRHVKMGERMLESGDFQKAAEQARKAIEKEPAAAEGHVLLGLALAGAGDCKGAVPALRKALELDRDNAKAAEGLKACGGKAK